MGVSASIRNVGTRAADAWRSMSERRPGIAHAGRGYQRYKANHGDHLAAAITYFSFLALFPLILLGASAAGFVFATHPSLADDLYISITRNVPGDFGQTLVKTVKSAIANRASVGIIGLAGVAFAGLGWVGNLRTAIDTVWGLPQVKRPFFKAKLSDAIVLLGLAIGVMASLALTAGGTAASGAVLQLFGLADVSGAGFVTAVLGIVLGILGSSIVFAWLLIRLPQVQVSRRTAIRVTLLAAIGFEILKVVGTYYIARVIRSPAAAAIGPVVGILIWIDLVSRFLLYCVAWAATAAPLSRPEPLVEEVPRTQVSTAERPPDAMPGISPLGLAAGLLSTGAAIGVAVVAALQRRRRLRGRQQ
jgi:membrane protein